MHIGHCNVLPVLSNLLFSSSVVMVGAIEYMLRVPQMVSTLFFLTLDILYLCTIILQLHLRLIDKNSIRSKIRTETIRELAPTKSIIIILFFFIGAPYSFCCSQVPYSKGQFTDGAFNCMVFRDFSISPYKVTLRATKGIVMV